VRQLELSLQHREREIEELQVVPLNDCYRESYQEAQDLHFEWAGIAFRVAPGRGRARGVGRSQLTGTCTPFVTMCA